MKWIWWCIKWLCFYKFEWTFIENDSFLKSVNIVIRNDFFKYSNNCNSRLLIFNYSFSFLFIYSFLWPDIFSSEFLIFSFHQSCNYLNILTVNYMLIDSNKCNTNQIFIFMFLFSIFKKAISNYCWIRKFERNKILIDFKNESFSMNVYTNL